MVIMRQFGRCGYCRALLTDSAQTDHMDENCGNDTPGNLIACCGTCHADKTQHYRKRHLPGRGFMLASMLEVGRQNKAEWAEEWASEDDHWAKLPGWLCERLTVETVLVHASRRRAALARQAAHTQLDLEQFRYKPGGAAVK